MLSYNLVLEAKFVAAEAIDTSKEDCIIVRSTRNTKLPATLN